MKRLLSLGCLLTNLVAFAGCDRREAMQSKERRIGNTRDAGYRSVIDAGGLDAARVAPSVDQSPRSGGGTPSAGTLDGSILDAGAGARAEAKFKAAKGYDLAGTVNFSEMNHGVQVRVAVSHGPKGKKGIHIHEEPDCSDIPGKSMGEHFAPAAKTHALPEVPVRHLGDLGNLEIGADGKGQLEIFVPHATLKENDTMSYLERAVVIHEFEDKGTQPSGAAGRPIACAVIEKVIN